MCIRDRTRKLLGLYDQNAMMIRAGLYAHGTDPEVDQAIALWSDLDAFLGKTDGHKAAQYFQQLELILRRSRQQGRGVAQPKDTS